MHGRSPALLLALTMTPASAKWVEKTMTAQNLKVFCATRAAHDPRAAAKMADARLTTVSVGVLECTRAHAALWTTPSPPKALQGVRTALGARAARADVHALLGEHGRRAGGDRWRRPPR